MVASYDRLTDELQRSCIRLNDELVFTPQKYGPEHYFHIEIPSTSKFFRVGYNEYVFISLLDGKTTFAHALAVAAQRLGTEALSEDEAKKVLSWLLENGLAAFADKKDSIETTQAEKAKTTLLQKANPFWIKLPFGNPDSLFRATEPYLLWLFHPAAVIVSLGIMFAALVTALSSWDQISAGCEGILAPDNWLWILLTWVFLKVIHEYAHGLACRANGGVVKETGLIFILLAPMAYVDVTSAWRIQSRWKRIAIAGAGMYVELLTASLAVFGLFFADSQIQRQLLINVIVMASVTTIMFNANPLMRFDGYFILSDLMKIPNLYTSGMQSFKELMTWVFYGTKVEQSNCEIRNHHVFLTFYGICAAIWKVVICIGLAITSSVMFGGLGILLAALGTVSWFAKPVAGLVKNLIRQLRQKPHSVIRCSMICGALATVLICSWFYIPNPFSARSPCVVDFKDESKVRTITSGFVSEILVEDGQFVSAGAPLIRLENKDLEVEVQELRVEVQSHTTRENIAMDEQEPGDAQIAEFNRRSAFKRLDERLQEQKGLTLLAPVSGYVVARNIKQLSGRHFERGDEVLTIGDDSNKEIVLSIAPGDVRSTLGLVGQSIPVEIGSRRKIIASIKRVDPRASVRLTRPAMAVPYGGSLAVKPVDNEDEGSEFELIESRFHAVATIDESTSKNLHAGERGVALLDSNSNTIGKWIYQSTYRWLEDQLEVAAQTAASF